RDITLGGEGFHMTAKVTSRGAGVRQVILNRFKAANWRGQPTDQPLELIQDDEFAPSFRMYVYEDPQAENPVFGLGEHIWKVEKEKVTTEDGSHEIQLSATIPGMDYVKIKKTYRLAP